MKNETYRTFTKAVMPWAIGLACSSYANAQQAPDAPVPAPATQSGASAAPAPAAAPAVVAPAAPGDAVDTVVVTGARASLAKSLDIKRNAAVVVDSISATELGRFPDDNVADSLSHINGVSITRTAGGEGQYVGIRGLPSGYAIVTLNNRILATDGEGRDFAFDVLPSEVISGADVLKSAEAGQLEGGIGGVVNLKSARPFDNPGFHTSLRAEGDYNDMSYLHGSKVSGVVSATSPDKTMGILVGAVVSTTRVRSDTLNYNTYDASTPGSFDVNGNGAIDPNEQNLLAHCCIAFGSTFEQKKRDALSATFEWRPSRDFKLSVDGLATRLDAPQVGYNQAYYAEYTPGNWSNAAVTKGLISSMTVSNFVPEVANVTVARKVTTNQIGLNAEWRATPDLTLTGDLYSSKSIRDEGGNDTFVVSGIAGNNTLHWSDNARALPNLSVTLENGMDLATGLANGQLGDANYGLHYVGLSGDNVHDTVTGATLNGRYALDLGVVESIDFGVTATNRKKTKDHVDNDWTGGSCQYCNMYGTTFASLGSQVVSTLTLPNFMQGAGGVFPKSFVSFNVPAYLAALKKLNGQPNTNPGVPDGTLFDFSQTLPTLDPVNSYVVDEKSLATFAQANLAGEGWTGNVGLRLIRTRTKSSTSVDNILSVYDPTPDVATSSPTVTYSDPQATSASGSYSMPLPSANFAYWLQPKLQLRLDAAQVMSRPALNQLAQTQTDQTINRVYELSIAGNPDLKPTKAWQQDLSLEWYYQPKSALTMALFAKQIKDFITTQTTNNVDIGVPGHLYTVQMPVNGDRGLVEGIELGLQHLYDNGFGVRVQYTHIQSKAWVMGQYVGQLEAVVPSRTSLGLIYEKGPISSSLSFDYTSKYTVNSTTEANLPNIADPLLWVTASASYDLNKHVKLFFEGKNLSNAVYRSTLGDTGALYGFSAWGRTFTGGVSVKF